MAKNEVDQEKIKQKVQICRMFDILIKDIKIAGDNNG